MTQGYPDFQRVQQRIGAALIDDSGVSVSDTHKFGPVYVGTWPAVLVSALQATSGTATVSLLWSDTEAANVAVATESWQYANKADFQVIRPVVAQWLSIQVDTTSVGDQTWLARVVPTSNVPAGSDSLSDPVLIDTPAATLAAGGDRTVTADVLRDGPAALAWQAGAADFGIELEYLTNTGTWNRLLQVASTATLTGDVIGLALPRAVVRLHLSNGGSAAHSVGGTLVGM